MATCLLDGTYWQVAGEKRARKRPQQFDAIEIQDERKVRVVASKKKAGKTSGLESTIMPTLIVVEKNATSHSRANSSEYSSQDSSIITFHALKPIVGSTNCLTRWLTRTNSSLTTPEVEFVGETHSIKKSSRTENQENEILGKENKRYLQIPGEFDPLILERVKTALAHLNGPCVGQVKVARLAEELNLETDNNQLISAIMELARQQLILYRENIVHII